MGLKEDVNVLSNSLLEMSSAVQKIRNEVEHGRGFVNWVPIEMRPGNKLDVHITNGGWIWPAQYMAQMDAFMLPGSGGGPVVSPDAVTHWAVIPRPEGTP